MIESAPKRILYVDDNVDACVLLTTALRLEGIDVHSVQNAEEALSVFSQTDFALIVLDVWLPGTSGIELCKIMRERGCRLPIIFYSAAAYTREVTGGIEAGGDQYFVKPELENLLAAIKEITLTRSSAGA